MRQKRNISTRCLKGLVALAVITLPITAFTQETRSPRNLEEFNELFQEFNNWGRWGDDDERGTMNLITAEKTREAASLVRKGITVSLSHNPMPDEAIDNPDAAFNHTMGQSLRSDTMNLRITVTVSATSIHSVTSSGTTACITTFRHLQALPKAAENSASRT